MTHDSTSPEPSRVLAEIGLFRAEAIEHARSGRFGTIVLKYPHYQRIVVMAMVLVTFAVVTIVGSFNYTSKVEIEGVLLPREGLVRVPAPKTGLLLYSTTSEGKRVKTGDILFAIRTDSITDSGADTSTVVKRTLSERRNATMQEKREIEVRAAGRARESAARLNEIRQQILELSSEIKIQQSAVDLAQASAERVRKLFASRYVSQLDVNREEDLVLQAKLQLAGLKRNLSSLRQEEISERSAQDDRNRESRSNLASIAENLAALDLQDAESSFDQRQLIRAPVDGTVSGITVSAGQTVSSGKVLASIEPSGSELIAELYATSKAIGLIKPGKETWLRFEAFPYQTYGQSYGVIESISRSAMQNDDFINTGFNSLPAKLSSQPVYRIRVRLKKQDVTMGPTSYPLRSGMIVQSVIPIRSRRLYQLVVDPLREIGGISK